MRVLNLQAMGLFFFLRAYSSVPLTNLQVFCRQCIYSSSWRAYSSVSLGKVASTLQAMYLSFKGGGFFFLDVLIRVLYVSKLARISEYLSPSEPHTPTRLACLRFKSRLVIGCSNIRPVMSLAFSDFLVSNILSVILIGPLTVLVRLVIGSAIYKTCIELGLHCPVCGRALSVRSTAIPHPLNMGIVRECGGKMQKRTILYEFILFIVTSGL